MGASSAEKEWLRKLAEGQTAVHGAVEEEERQYASSETAVKKAGKAGGGFKDIAGMDELKTFVTENFINVLNHRECAKAYGIQPPSLMLYGPAGCGKTYFAEAIACELGVNFMKIIPDDIGSKWVHGTQEKIAEVFREAERKAPTLLFFDEFDAMVPTRTEGDHGYQNGEVNEFLCMMNNASQKGVYIITATNHPENIDSAVLRTGRIDELIYIDMPDKASRESLFRLSLSKLPVAADIDYGHLADMTCGYNCSDISYIVKVAARKMFNASIQEGEGAYMLISQPVLEEPIAHKSPSVTEHALREYERVRNMFAPGGTRQKPTPIGFR